VADEGGVCMENLLKTGLTTDGVSSPLHQQFEEYTQHRSKRTDPRATKKSRLYIRGFKKNSRKAKKLSLEREIKALEKHAEHLTFIIMYARKHITALMEEHKDVLKKLHCEWYKNDVINIERDSLVRQINILREKRDWLSSTVRSTEAELEVLKAQRDALKLEVENLRRHSKDAATLGKRLNTVTEHCDEPPEEFTQETVDLILEPKRPEGHTKAIKKVRDALKLETNDLRVQYKDAETLKENRDSLTLGAKGEAKCTKTIKEERDALKLEAEHLQGQCIDAAAVKEQLSYATVQRPKLRIGRRTLVVIVTILALFFFVGLLWTLSDSLNICEMVFFSPYKRSLYRISVTARCSSDIIV
jgi:chromosome segregation ATPase